MPVTAIKAVVNMTDRRVTLINHEDRSALPVTAEPLSVVSCNMYVPWCFSAGEFDGKRLSLSFEGSPRPVTDIYQHTNGSGDFVRFTLTGAPDLRFGFDSDYHESRAHTGFNPDARALASDRSGTPFRVVGDADVVLCVDERNWVILYRIGEQPRR